MAEKKPNISLLNDLALFKGGYRNVKLYDPAVRPYIYEEFQRMTDVMSIKDAQLCVADRKYPAACSLNSNVVIISKPLLDLLDDKEVVGMIAHELTHLNHPEHFQVGYSKFPVTAVAAYTGYKIGDKVKSRLYPQQENIATDESNPAITRRGFFRRTGKEIIPFAAGYLSIKAVDKGAYDTVQRFFEKQADLGGAELCGDRKALISAFHKLDDWFIQNNILLDSGSHGTFKERTNNIENHIEERGGR